MSKSKSPCCVVHSLLYSSITGNRIFNIKCIVNTHFWQIFFEWLHLMSRWGFQQSGQLLLEMVSVYEVVLLEEITAASTCWFQVFSGRRFRLPWWLATGRIGAHCYIRGYSVFISQNYSRFFCYLVDIFVFFPADYLLNDLPLSSHQSGRKQKTVSQWWIYSRARVWKVRFVINIVLGKQQEAAECLGDPVNLNTGWTVPLKSPAVDCKLESAL